MYISKVYKKNSTSDKKYYYYRLMRSYRIGNKVRQEFILNLGTLENVPVNKHKSLADKIEDFIENGTNIIFECDPEIDELATKFYHQILETKKEVNKKIITKQPVDSPDAVQDFQEVDLNSVNSENAREIGCEWLSFQAIEQIGLDKIIQNKPISDKLYKSSLISIISRMVHPASDLETERWLNENTALNQLFDIPSDFISRHDLTKAANFLLDNKQSIETGLYKNISNLFSLQSKIVIYDLTNIFFEGRKLGSNYCKFGRSKEKRNDCRLICLALLIDENGFIFFSKFYAGNQSEPQTLADVVADLKQKTNTEKNISTPVIVMDAGITTEDNLADLRRDKIDYVCVSRCKLNKYELIEIDPIIVTDKRENKIELKKVKSAEKEDYFVYVKSEQKQAKEQSMNEKFTEKFENDLKLLTENLQRKGSRRKNADVHQKIGRLKERHSSVSRFYEIKFIEDTVKTGTIKLIEWTKKESIKDYEGTYFIRYSNENLTTEQIWQTYNTIREVESTFRAIKTDLRIRPVYHRDDKQILSHIFLGIIAYQTVNTIRFQLKKKEINLSWEKLVQKLNTYKSITTDMSTKNGKKILLKYCIRPTPEVVKIFQNIGYKILPFRKQKYVVT